MVIDFDVLSNQFLTYYQQFSLADQFVLFYEVQNLEVTQPLIYNIIWPVSEYINYPADKINNLLSQLVDQTNESGLHPTIVLQLVAGTSVLNASLLGLSIGVYMSGLRTIASYLNSFFLLTVIDVWFIYMIFESTFRLHMFNAVFFGAIAIILISRTLKNPIKNIFNRLCLSSKKMRFI